MGQLEAVLGEREGAQERRGERERVNGRAGVVHEAGQRQLGGAAASAEARLGLEHAHAAAGPGQGDCRSQPVRAGPDDDRLGAGLRQPRPASRPGRERSCATGLRS